MKTKTPGLFQQIYTEHWGTDFPDDPIVWSSFAQIEAEYLEQSGINEKHAALTSALEKAVADYGKPGGPWNVPSEPGTWIQMARDALRKGTR